MNRGFYNYAGRCPEINTDPSKTVPDQSLTVREIISRFTRGQMELGYVDSGDDESLDSDDLRFEDLADASEIVSRGSFLIQELENQRVKDDSEKVDGDPGDSKESSDL